MSTKRYAQVSAVGSSLPSRRVPNSYFESILDTSDEWIADRTGIRERRFAGSDETTSSMATLAARRALESGGVAAGAVDLIIIATCTPDRLMPATGAFVQAALGISCPAFDLNAACAGFVYGLSVGSSQIQAGSAERVLVIGAETLSRVVDIEDRTTSVLFGDGAGAALLEPADDPGLMDSILAMDGKAAELLTIPAGGTEEPATVESVVARRHSIRMPDGRVIFRRAVLGMASASSQLLDKAGVSPEDVDLVIAHQANARIISSVGDRLGIDSERIFLDIEKVGNTSAASIPIAMDRAWREGLLSPGNIVLTVAFGAGLAWGANLLRWTASAPAHETAPDAPPETANA